MGGVPVFGVVVAGGVLGVVMMCDPLCGCVLLSCFRSLRASCQEHDDDLVGQRRMRASKACHIHDRISDAASLRGLGPWAGALVGQGHQVVQARTSHRVQDALTFLVSEAKRLPPD